MSLKGLESGWLTLRTLFGGIVATSIRFSSLVVSLGVLLGAGNGALADPPSGPDAGAASTSDAPKTLPEGSVFLSLQQSFKENPDVLEVRGHFDLGTPPKVQRYYCLINIKTGHKDLNGVLGELVPRKGGTTGIKNIAVSLYSCADAQQQGMLVTAGYVLSGAASVAMASAAQAQTSTLSPPPPPVLSANKVGMSLEQIDIAGVRLGMSPDEVRAALKSKKLLDYDESAETLSYLDPAKAVMQPISNGHFVNLIAAWTPPAISSAGDTFEVDGESYEVMFTPVPGKERAMAIVHSVGYSLANAVQEATLESGLVNKYGGFSGPNDLPESPTWRLQSSGTLQVGDSCNRRGVFGGLGGLNVAKVSRENLALKRAPEDFKNQIDRCGIAIVTEDHFTANGGALHADRLVTRFTVTAYSPALAFEGAKTAAELIKSAGGPAKKSDAPRVKDQPASNL
jgi:hypothetical protein